MVEKNKRIIYKVSFMYTNNQTDREDLIQEIYYQIWRSSDGYRQEAGFGTWMYRVAINTAINALRSNKKLPITEELDREIPCPEQDRERDEQRQMLFRAIDNLNKIEKAIILLWLEEKSYDEIAVIMGLSKTNISVKLVRIRKKLEELLNEMRYG